MIFLFSFLFLMWVEQVGLNSPKILKFKFLIINQNYTTLQKVIATDD